MKDKNSTSKPYMEASTSSVCATRRMEMNWLIRGRKVQRGRNGGRNESKDVREDEVKLGQRVGVAAPATKTELCMAHHNKNKINLQNKMS